MPPENRGIMDPGKARGLGAAARMPEIGWRAGMNRSLALVSPLPSCVREVENPTMIRACR